MLPETGSNLAELGPFLVDIHDTYPMPPLVLSTLRPVQAIDSSAAKPPTWPPEALALPQMRRPPRRGEIGGTVITRTFPIGCGAAQIWSAIGQIWVDVERD